jgi:hypothetical protein
MRLRARVDANQAALVAHAKAFGASWLDMSQLGKGKPDGAFGLHGTTFLVAQQRRKAEKAAAA